MQQTESSPTGSLFATGNVRSRGRGENQSDALSVKAGTTSPRTAWRKKTHAATAPNLTEPAVANRAIGPACPARQRTMPAGAEPVRHSSKGQLISTVEIQ